MPFPYMYPIGALLAGILLGATLTVFAVVLHTIDRVATWAGQAAVAGLVSGFRGWSELRRPVEPASSSDDGDGVGTTTTVPVEAVRARAGRARR